MATPTASVRTDWARPITTSPNTRHAAPMFKAYEVGLLAKFVPMPIFANGGRVVIVIITMIYSGRAVVGVVV